MRHVLRLMAVLAMAAASSPQIARAQQAADLEAVRQAKEPFLATVGAYDLAGMESPWRHEAYVRAIHPFRPIDEGWDAVRDGWPDPFERFPEMSPAMAAPHIGIVGVVAASTLSFSANAQDGFPSDLPSECTLDNVAGVFGFNEDSLMNPSEAEGATAVIGILDLRPDGTAAMRVRVFTVRGGDALTIPAVEGEWSIEPNCSGLIDFPPFELARGGRAEIDFAFVAVENASELFLINNNPLEEADAKLLFRR